MAEADATRECVVCGSEFKRDGKRIMCSGACRIERQKSYHRAQPNNLTCLHCGAGFNNRPNARYCSRECKDAHRVRDSSSAAISAKKWRQANKAKIRAVRMAYRARKPRDRAAEFESWKAKRRYAREAAAVPALLGRIAFRAQLMPGIRQALRVARAAERAHIGDGRVSGSHRLRADPEAYATALQRWRARSLKRKTGKVMADDGTVTAAVMFAGKRCLYCNCAMTKDNRTHDHMDPLSTGGVNSACNIAPCCHSCNSSKGAKPFATYVATLGQEHMIRAVKFYEKRNGPMIQMGLRLAA